MGPVCWWAAPEHPPRSGEDLDKAVCAGHRAGVGPVGLVGPLLVELALTSPSAAHPERLELPTF